MTINITEKIPMQGFEKVLYKIGEVLFLELSAQKTTHQNIGDFEVFLERMTAYDKSENIMINVTSSNINYSNFTQSDSTGKTDFAIEVYSPLEHTFINGDDKVNTFTLHKVVGMIRYILQSTKYNTLGFQPGLIGNTTVESIQFFDDFNNQDGANIRLATLVFSAKVCENQELWNGISIENNTTQIKLCDTDKGYKLIKTA